MRGQDWNNGCSQTRIYERWKQRWEVGASWEEQWVQQVRGEAAQQGQDAPDGAPFPFIQTPRPLRITPSPKSFPSRPRWGCSTGDVGLLVGFVSKRLGISPNKALG